MGTGMVLQKNKIIDEFIDGFFRR